MDNQDSCKSTITPHAIELELTDVDDTDEELEGRRNEIESEGGHNLPICELKLN